MVQGVRLRRITMKTNPSSKLGVTLAAALALWLPAIHSDAQLLGYESFSGMTLGSGVTGSGSTATGWSDAGWAGGSDLHFQTVDPTPDLTYQISGGALLAGGDRALQLSTAPEPITLVLEASRNVPSQNTTVYFSFLLRPVNIGSGSDSIELRLGSGAFFDLRPDAGGTFLKPGVHQTNGSGLSNGLLYPGNTYLVVVRLAYPTLQFWINPTAAYPGNGSGVGSGSPSGVSNVAFRISSADTGGPSTSVIIDELRVGYTWVDVVPSAPRQHWFPA